MEAGGRAGGAAVRGAGECVWGDGRGRGPAVVSAEGRAPPPPSPPPPPSSPPTPPGAPPTPWARAGAGAWVLSTRGDAGDSEGRGEVRGSNSGSDGRKRLRSGGGRGGRRELRRVRDSGGRLGGGGGARRPGGRGGGGGRERRAEYGVWEARRGVGCGYERVMVEGGRRYGCVVPTDGGERLSAGYVGGSSGQDLTTLRGHGCAWLGPSMQGEGGCVAAA